MYLKKVNGPRAVTLPGGEVLTRADLPTMETKRWVASRKLKVVSAIEYGLISSEDAMEMYALSEEEIEEWKKALHDGGIEKLKATRQR